MKILQITILVYSLSLVRAEQFCRKEIYESEFHTLDHGHGLLELEVLAIWSPAHTGARNIANLCSSHTGLTIERQCTVDRHAAHGTWNDIDKRMELLNCSVIDNLCVAEEFEHFYLKRNKVMETHTNKWPAAEIGELAKTDDPCLLETGLPLTRKCIYNPRDYVAVWEKKEFKNVKCLRDISQKLVTYDLNDLYKEVRGDPGLNVMNSTTVATKLTNLLSDNKTVRIATDLEITTNILKAITTTNKDPNLAPKVLEVTNLLMQSDESVVLSSAAMDTPKTLLKTVDTYFDSMTNVLMPTSKCANVSNGVEYYSQNLTSVFYINPICSNISGIAVYNRSAHQTLALHYDRPTNTYFRYLYLNQTVAEIIQEPYLEAAAYFPQDLWKKLIEEAAGKSNLQAVRFSLYRNKNLFVDLKHNERTPDTVVLKMSIPGYADDLPGYVPLIFQQSRTVKEEKPQCGYYDSGINTWNSTGVTISRVENVALCKTKRLTSFGALLGLNSKPRVLTDSVVLTVITGSAQDIISIAGCGLSLFGLVCIWLTALCCKQWRLNSSNKLLLNICLVLTLLMAYFLFINIPEIREAVINISNFHHCIIEGAFLQYTVLVLFLWMLITAIFQFHRYVTVIGVQKHSEGYVKYMLAAWGLPLIPTGLVIYFDPSSYMPLVADGEASNGICYPSGRSFFYALLFPISIIIVVNICIFLYIMCSVRRSLQKFKHCRERKDFLAQVRLSILLFFLLGISWVFGILAHVEDSGVFSFLFCVTSTLQGFVLFVYVVIIDKSARYSWLQCCCSRAYYPLEESGMTPLSSLNSQRTLRSDVSTNSITKYPSIDRKDRKDRKINI